MRWRGSDVGVETVIASLPWYDLPSVQWANDVLWRATGLGGSLDRVTPPEAQWRSPDLLVTQACGLDLFLSGAPTTPVLAPVFELDCEAGWYYSYLIGAREGVAAVNALSSRSGWSALLTVCEPKSVVVTGSHLASLAAVRDGGADMACIDAVTWHILARDAPRYLRGLPLIERTDAAPAPPFVVRKGTDPRALVARVGAAIEDPATLAARRALLLRGVVPATLADYAPVLREYRQVLDRVGGRSSVPEERPQGSATRPGFRTPPGPAAGSAGARSP